MKFINLTRRTEIGANCYCLESGGQNFVLDCGMHPKEEGDEALPNFKAMGDRELDAIIISHAHQDHLGTLPVLMRRQPQARVFMTEATAEIGSTLLHNSVNVMTRQREELGTTLYPLFTHKEANRATEAWRSCRFRQAVSLKGERSGHGVTFEFIDAGHVLGSAGVILRAEGRTFLYSGDVNFDDQTIAQGAVFPESGIDVLIMECTRGDAPQPEGFTRAAEERRWAEAIGRAFERGGCVLMPVFALGKTQETLALIHRFRREKVLGDFPLYIGGLSMKMTQIYDRFSLTSRRNFPRLQLLEQLEPFVLNGQTIGDAPAKPGRIYALSSGMMTPKTLSNIFARRVLEDPRSTRSSLSATRIRSRPRESCARRSRAIWFRSIPTSRRENCAARSNRSSSARTPRANRFSPTSKKLAPKKVVLVHGDPPAVAWMHAQVSAALPEAEVIVPQPGVEIEL